nr:MAG: hypothetical protein [Bacteriophage sp.]
MGKVAYEIVKWGDECGYGCVVKQTTKGWFKTETLTWTLIPHPHPTLSNDREFSRWTCLETGESTRVGEGFKVELIYMARYSLRKNPTIPLPYPGRDADMCSL